MISSYFQDAGDLSSMYDEDLRKNHYAFLKNNFCKIFISEIDDSENDENTNRIVGMVIKFEKKTFTFWIEDNLNVILPQYSEIPYNFKNLKLLHKFVLDITSNPTEIMNILDKYRGLFGSKYYCYSHSY